MALLFADLLEARAYRRADSLERYEVHELARILFLHLLTLCLLHKTKFGNEYARATLLYPMFDGIRFSSTDLANLISAYRNSERYLGVAAPPLPFLQLKRFLRSAEYSDWSSSDIQDNRAIFYKLQQTMKLSNDSSLNKLRRDIADGQLNSHAEHMIVTRMLYNQIRKTTYNSDLIAALHDYMEEIGA